MKKVYLEQELEIEDIIFPNKGIGQFEGKKVYVKNTIPGQKVKVNIKKKKQKFEGRLLEIIHKADYEIEPECDDFGVCGGCTYHNISYEKELEIKKNNVLKLLNEAGITDYKFLGINPSPNIYEYRNKMEFSFGDTGQEGDISLGMKKRNSYYEVVNASKCKLVSEDIRKVLYCVLNYFKNTNQKFYHRIKKEGTLRHLLVRQGKFTGEMIVGIVTTNKMNISLDDLKNELLQLSLKGEIVGIAHIINDSVSDVIKADEVRLLFGRDYFYEKILGLKFKISIFSFFQTNSEGAEVLYNAVKKFSDEQNNKVIFDLYCGTGTISQLLSKNSEKVFGIEIIDEAMIAAKENSKLNGISNCNFISGDVNKVVEQINTKPDLIVLDPPREGINPKAINKIINFDAKRIIYISCKASSLSKDLKCFIENGYKIDKLELVDMFPRTYHVESVVLMSKVQN